MARIFLSSTYEDLSEYRNAAITAGLRLGHQVVGLEDYSGEERPRDTRMGELAESDVYVGIVAWRYGYVPEERNPERLSITHLEFREARKLGRPCLVFLLSEQAPWPRRFIDKSAEAIQRFRKELQASLVVGHFHNPADFESNLIGSLAMLGREGEEGRVRTPTVPLDAFLSYNSADRDAVMQLARRLIADGVHIWMFDLSIKPGAEFQPETDSALHRAASVVCFIGGSGVGKWQQDEAEMAHGRRQAGENVSVIPVLLPGSDSESVPVFLKQYFWIRFRSLDDREAYSQLLRALAGEQAPARDGGPLQEADLQTLIELLFRMAVRLRERPEMLNSVEPTAVWDAVRKISPQASSMEDLKRLNQELSTLPTPGPLWAAWMRHTRPVELAALVHHGAARGAPDA